MTKAKAVEITGQEFLVTYSKKPPEFPCFAILGGDAFTMHKVLQTLVKHFVDERSRDFDYVRLYGDEIKNNAYLEQLDTLPLMAEKLVVVLRDLDLIKAENLARLPAYLQNPSPSTILIITADSIDARTTLGKQIAQYCYRIICKEPQYPKQISAWLIQELQKRQKRMELKAIEFFCATVPIDYYMATNELDKVELYAPDAKIFTYEDVRQAMGAARSHTVFELTDSVGNKKCLPSIRILESMLQNDEKPLMILAMLQRFYLQMWRINALRRKNISVDEIEKRFLPDIYLSFRKDAIRTAANFNIHELRRIFQLLLKADADLKSSGQKEGLIMNLLIYRLCHPHLED